VFGLSVSFYQLLTFAILPMALTLSLLAGWVVPKLQAWGTLKQVYQQQVLAKTSANELPPSITLCSASQKNVTTPAICLSGQPTTLVAISQYQPFGLMHPFRQHRWWRGRLRVKSLAGCHPVCQGIRHFTGG
jgi:hypothetical protein